MNGLVKQQADTVPATSYKSPNMDYHLRSNDDLVVSLVNRTHVLITSPHPSDAPHTHQAIL